LSLFSYHTQDTSWNTSSQTHSANLVGRVGAHIADLGLQLFGLSAFVFPAVLVLLAWKWVRSENIESPLIKVLGWVLFLASMSGLLGLIPEVRFFSGAIPAGGLTGTLLADYARSAFNLAGTIVIGLTCLVISIYLISTFTVSKLAAWSRAPFEWIDRILAPWGNWKLKRRERFQARAERRSTSKQDSGRQEESPQSEQDITPVQAVSEDAPPSPPPLQEIPIRVVEDSDSDRTQTAARVEPHPAQETDDHAVQTLSGLPKIASPPEYHLPSTELLNEPVARSLYDEQELKETAARIKAKFEEFNVLGSVVQINPGPVVTTFEFKPEAGIKYSRITTLAEDLCLGLQAESILIERIPGKPTVGIEVPNTKREVIGLRQILESDEFQNSPSRLPIPLGKDINGRIKVAWLESMPHLLIAGSTGSGKSVMLNSMIMALLFRSTPEQVRMILVDPKRLELGLYEGVPHLLTPVITDPKKATNALRNAVLEMERRLRLLAAKGVRNIEQYNKKIRQLLAEPRSLFEADGEETELEELEPLPYIVIFIDELADLMMVERANVEESVTRLAQMARAVGIHLVLATQRPSVDVLTGLIKANFPVRMSFRMATRVDSRTILDVMGAEHLLGKGDMLFLPPGSSRLMRVHGPLVTEREINAVVDFWKQQASPTYDSTYLVAPPSEEEEADMEENEGERDPLYEEAVRVVLEMGKASTSTLQRRLRLGYGRAARILDMMQREGIIGPPDGSRPRELLKRPDWLTDRGPSFE
jgi:S-DNA-T family DNA segregation ATPase FtsK/SpoIIIE